MKLSRLPGRSGWRLSVPVVACLLASRVAAQPPDLSEVAMSAQEIRAGIHMLSGAGGNLALSVGDDGVLLVDDELEPLGPRVEAAIERLAGGAVDYLINTHWHFDHVGNNARFAGQGAVLIAHDQVRARMAAGQFVPAFQLDVPPAESAALPVLTFASSLALHLNGQTVEVIHEAAAHTDGDALVYFTQANVVHMGDLYWNGLFPLVDDSSGGTLRGMIAGVDNALARMDGQTVVIPGHGRLSNREELQAYREMLHTAWQRLSAHRARGDSLDSVLAAAPLADLDDAWGAGLFDATAWTRMIYPTLQDGAGN